MPIIYVSAMKTNISGEQIFDERAITLFELLKEAGFELFGQKQWRDYKNIEQEIALCDALLAIVDKTWQSSTWMASEITWANGQKGAVRTSNPRIKPIPIFLYPVLEKAKWGWLDEFEGPIVLDKDVNKAVAMITDILL